ncbi:hypothetical protein PIB30_010889 [Stylosanthes scabra]|uniref:Uncharacterized protein n=1 Tax=Stylosanthes scabra TaxID=79078 RepID=A0ABU6S5Y8_9FABA|nr:hypothetical protein [Stylosanthes scabra]
MQHCSLNGGGSTRMKVILFGKESSTLVMMLAMSLGDDGEYSVKSFIQAATGRELGVSTVKHVYDNIWRGLVPSRVEMMAWFVITEKDKFVIGGYFTDELNRDGCWMGEDTVETIQGASLIDGLESAIQFMLEDMNLDYWNATLISSRKDIVTWAQNNDKTCWDSRFIRNKTKNLKREFKEVKLMYQQETDFILKDKWIELAKDGDERWVKWE